MASKIFFVCAFVCAIQGLNGAAINPSFQSAQAPEIESYQEALGYFHDLEEQYGRIINELENIFFNTEFGAPESEFNGLYDEVMQSVEGFTGSDAEEEEVDMEVVRKCVEEQAPNFKKFVEDMRLKVANAKVQLRQMIVDTLGPYVMKAREAFRALAEEIVQFPIKIWECIKENNFLKVLEVIQKTRQAVVKHANEIEESIRGARAQFPVIREKAMQIREQLRNEAQAGMKVIRDAIKQCIANGGPKAE